MKTKRMHLHKAIENSKSIEVTTDNSFLLHFSFTSISLEKSAKLEISASSYRDIAILLLSGDISVELDSSVWRLSRSDMFQSPPTGLLLRSNSLVRIASKATNSKVGIAVALIAESSMPIDPFVVSDDCCRTEARGQGAYRRLVRTVDHGLKDFAFIVGETLSTGTWSSYPPHKHDEAIAGIETEHEEIYLHHFKPEHAWGFQGISSPREGLEEAFFIRHGDVVAIPHGYHPVASEPLSQHHYLWILCGPEKSPQIHTHSDYEQFTS